MNLQVFINQIGYYGPVFLLVIAIFLVVEALLRGYVNRRRKSRQVNDRLQLRQDTDNGKAAYVELLKRRGLTSDGDYQLPLFAFNKLVVQSGVTMSIYRLIIIMACVGLASGIGIFFFTVNPFTATGMMVLAGLVVPVLILMLLRSIRQSRFEDQLPEAVDVMVRSMRAGHPLPAAISMVGREMPDPIGTEFGLVADEMTYGLDIDTALTNLRMRVSQSDLSFLAVAVSIQSKTGGNLSEILGKLSGMIRERSRMRRKIKSLSAEGRFSAMALSAIPILIYTLVSITAPTYYGAVRDAPAFSNALYFGITIWSMGIYVMYRMVNFKI
jgi:tight adherence protein B